MLRDTAIAACRAECLQVGHVVKLNAVDRRRVLEIAPVEGAPVYLQGRWEVLTSDTPRVETFVTVFARWYTIEHGECHV